MKKYLQFFTICAVLFFTTGTPVHAQTIWTEYGSNPIFGQGTISAGPKAYYPSVVYDASSFSEHVGAYLYKMWYGTSGGQTGLAYSNDGIVWNDQGTVMTNGYHAQVIYYASGFGGSVYYKMWYWGGLSYNASDIRFTESSDGVNWTNDQPLKNGTVVPYISGPMAWNRGSYGPCTIFYNPTATNTGTDPFDYTYTMYYDGTSGGTESIGLAYSTDGIEWNGYDANTDGKADPVLDGVEGTWVVNYSSSATIIKNAVDDYEMWYSGGIGRMNHGIGYATSTDGINWTKDASNPVFHKDDGIAWRDSRTYTPSVIRNGSTYKMWFTGKSTTGSNYSIGYATGAPPLPPPTEVWVDDDWTNQADVNVYNPGLTWQYNAFNSLQDGIDAVPSGSASDRSIVNVFNGDYQTPGQTIGGYKTGILVESLDYLTIQAVPGNEPTAKPLAGGKTTSLGIESSNHIIIDNIDLDGSLAGFDRLHVRNSNYITLKNSEVAFGIDGIDVETSGEHFLIENNVFKSLSGDAVDFSDGAYSDIIIQDNLFHSDNRRPILIRNLGALPIGDFIIRRNISLGTNNQEAFRIIGASNVLIENNVIMNSYQQGLYIDTNVSGGTTSSDITVQHNTFFNNGSDPGDNGEIKTKVTSSDIVIKNNIIYGNGSNPAFETGVNSLAGEDYNLVYNTTDISSFAFGSNTIIGDPLFTSTTAGSEDLHLQSGSPAIAAGTDLGVTDDLENNNRPQPTASNPDIGAYESEQPLYPMVLKQEVRDYLAGLLPSGDKKTDDRLEKAIKHIEKSLDDKLWEDGNYLTKKGKKVFDEEKKAVKELEKIVKEKKIDLLKTKAQTAIDKLVAIDKSLAQNMIDKAIAKFGDSKEIEKAVKEMEKAEKELSEKQHYDHAIDHYKKAWEHAYKALKKVGALGKYSTATDELAVNTIPEEFSLGNNYPNPFNPTTLISYNLPEASQVTMIVYDLMGRKVKALVQEFQPAGNHSVIWNATDDNGAKMSGGMYFYQIRAGSFQQTHKMILLK